MSSTRPAGVGGIARLSEVTDADAALVRRGRWLRTRFLLDLRDAAYLVEIVDGRVVAVAEGPFVMPSWQFALRADRSEWERFWARRPVPGSNDLFAMLKRHVLQIEGDLHPFMTNLLYFKALLGALREEAG
jgi:hypothetical protein